MGILSDRLTGILQQKGDMLSSITSQLLAYYGRKFIFVYYGSHRADC